MTVTGSCNQCAFFDNHPSASQAVSTDGLCRFNPPVTQPTPDAHGLWPVVSTDDWCGHFAGNGSAGQVAAE